MSSEGDQDGKAPNPLGSGGEAPGRSKNPPAAAPVIALRMEALLQWVAERVAKFPREHKFTVGDRLMETCLGVLEHLVEASYKRDKVVELAAASRLLVRARIRHRRPAGSNPVRAAKAGGAIFRP